MEVTVSDKFEYLVKTFRDSGVTNLTTRLNELGAEGWELIDINNNQLNTFYIFKRKITTIR